MEERGCHHRRVGVQGGGSDAATGGTSVECDSHGLLYPLLQSEALVGGLSRAPDSCPAFDIELLPGPLTDLPGGLPCLASTLWDERLKLVPLHLPARPPRGHQGGVRRNYGSAKGNEFLHLVQTKILTFWEMYNCTLKQTKQYNWLKKDGGTCESGWTGVATRTVARH